MRYSWKAGAVPAPTASGRSPRKQLLSKKRPPVSSVTPPALLRRFAAHGFVLTIALLAIAASSLGIAPFNATTPETPFNPTEWPQSVSSAPLHQDRQYMIKAAVPVTESSVDCPRYCTNPNRTPNPDASASPNPSASATTKPSPSATTKPSPSATTNPDSRSRCRVLSHHASKAYLHQPRHR